MSTAIDVLVLIITLIVCVWVALFGTAGAMLGRSRGATSAGGFLIGVCLGPFGLAWLIWRGRDQTR